MLLDRARLPPPVLQWEVPARRRLGRTDFGWPELRTVGEFDGRIKYGRLLRPGQEPGDVVFAEKRREDAIRDAGFRVVRWVWADLDDFGDVVARLRTAFAARRDERRARSAGRGERPRLACRRAPGLRSVAAPAARRPSTPVTARARTIRHSAARRGASPPIERKR